MRRTLFPFAGRSVGIAVLCCLAVLVLMATRSANTATTKPLAPCPNPPPVVITSSEVPTDVCIPDGFGGNPIQFFDDFSWRSFLALVWPAKTGERGMPDTSATLGADGPRVFDTYKSAWEIFHKDGSAPADWNTYEASQFNACGQAVEFGDLVLASFSKFSDIGQAGSLGTLVGPLVAQNMTYTRYLTGFNKGEFEEINNNKWYLRANLGTPAKPLTFQNGALDVKSAWIDMTKVAHPERYYVRDAWVMRTDGTCPKIKVGLVGLHIVQKTPSRPQWIWSSFEHVDNIPQNGGQAPFAFNDGSGEAMLPENPIEFPPPETPPLKFNVDRLKPIHSSTQKTNTAYRQALAQQNSVWQFYQLVMTQWPLQKNPPNPIPPSQTGAPDFTFPGSGSDETAFSNVTMETFDQSSIRRGCMACHNPTKVKSDFLWVLNTHSFDPTGDGGLLRDPAFRSLKQLLEVHRENEKQDMMRMMRLVEPKTRRNTKKRGNR